MLGTSLVCSASCGGSYARSFFQRTGQGPQGAGKVLGKALSFFNYESDTVIYHDIPTEWGPKDSQVEI